VKQDRAETIRKTLRRRQLRQLWITEKYTGVQLTHVPSGEYGCWRGGPEGGTSWVSLRPIEPMDRYFEFVEPEPGACTRRHSHAGYEEMTKRRRTVR
jgi:hypothetical protein